MGTFKLEDQRLVGSDGRLSVEFDGETGGVTQVENLETGHALRRGDAAPPWRLAAQGGSFDRWDDSLLPPSYESTAPEPASTDVSVSDDGRLATIEWETSSPGTAVTVELAFGDEGALECRPRVSVHGDERPPESLTFPVLTGLEPLSDGGEADELVFPYHSGWLVRNPLAEAPMAGPYPDGYNGCTMQFTGYFEDGVGGFYLGTHDPHSTSKYLTFGANEWSVRHDTWDLREGRSIDYDYPVVLAAMTRGDWYEAAERYREWALEEAPWITLDDPDAADREARRWLHEDVGLAVWGGSSSLDWSPFYEFYADVAGTPLHVCSGWGWPATRPHTVGEEGWFPADFHPANVEVWEDHYVTPYMNDCFVSTQAEDFFERWEPNLLLPYAQFSFDHFSKPHPDWIQGEAPDPDPAVVSDVNYFLCPETDAFQDLHSWRDATLVDDYPMAGVCYDIGSGNPWLWSRCWRAEHGHPPGRGRGLIQAYDELNRDSKAAARERTGEYLVQGVETVVENVLGSIDFYVMRAGAGPLGALETWLPAAEKPPGEGRELLPLFEAVYHDVGPVRHDGWLTLAEDQGDLFFWLTARIVLEWGGLLSLHYANNPPERPPDHDGPAEVVDWSGATLHWDDLPEPGESKTAFVSELATARSEFGRPYIGHGRLLRPVPCEIPSVTLGFERRISLLPGLVNTGNWEVPAVVQGAWEAPDGRVGVLLAAVGDEPEALSLEADCGSLWDLELAGRDVTVTTADGTSAVGTVSDDNQLELEVALEPRTVTLVEVAA